MVPGLFGHLTHEQADFSHRKQGIQLSLHPNFTDNPALLLWIRRKFLIREIDQVWHLIEHIADHSGCSEGM